MNLDERKHFTTELVKVIFKAKDAKCVHENLSTPCGPVIRSHSIQNSVVLDSLVEDGHVYIISNHETGQINLKKTSRNDASIFRGICNRHDSEMFSDIDFSNSKKFDKSLKQLNLLSLRALYKEYFAKTHIINCFEKLQKIIKNKDQEKLVEFAPALNKWKKNFPFEYLNLELLQELSLSHCLGLLDLEKLYEDLVKNVESLTLEHRVIEIDNKMLWAAAGICSPTYMPNGKEIYINSDFPSENIMRIHVKRLNQDNADLRAIARNLFKFCNPPQFMIINAFPYEERSIVIFSYMRTHTWMEEICNQIQKNPDSIQKEMISKFIISSLDNIVLSPNLLALMDNNQQHDLLEDARRTLLGNYNIKQVRTNLFAFSK